VLDVKVGSGAFMKTLDRARELAQTLVALGQDAGVKTSALLTDMSTPLGRKIGNALEVEESVEVLAGGGPADVVDLTVELATEMLRLAGKSDIDVRAALNDGRAMDKWNQMIRAQGGDPLAPMEKATESHTVVAEQDGYVSQVDALAVGVASWRLGAGRARKEDAVQFGAGAVLHVGIGDKVVKGQPLITLLSNQEERFARALEALQDNLTVVAQPVSYQRKIILETIKS